MKQEDIVHLIQSDQDTQLIVAALTNMVEKGMKPRDTFQLLDDLKSALFPALSQIYEETKEG